MDLKEASTANATDLLSTFLAQQKGAYLRAVDAGTAKDWIVVMGNEAGDLDSLACSIAYAYYAHSTGGSQSPAVPLIQTPRDDLALRAENQHALALAGVDPSALLCLSDLPNSSSPSHTFAIVDHNRLAPPFASPEARVVAVIDHHEDEQVYKDTADPRIVQVPTGSCASLVGLFLQRKQVSIPEELATLLLTAILVDTNGLKPGGKAEEADRAAAAFLAPRSTMAPESAARDLQPGPQALHDSPLLKSLTTTLLTKKASVDHLGTRNLLRRDYKEYAFSPAAGTGEVRVGLASVPIGLRAWLPRDRRTFADEARGWMDERGLHVLGVLTSFRDAEHAKPGKRGKHKREQLYVVRGADLAARLISGLEGSGELDLKRKGWEHFGVREEDVHFGEEYVVAVWKQKNVDATRKATAPLVKKIIEGGGKGASL